jgi:hypothetical protein
MRMSVELDEIASLTAEIEATSHVGRRNRLMTQRGHVYFILGRRAIEEARFDLAAMEMQCS